MTREHYNRYHWRVLDRPVRSAWGFMVENVRIGTVLVICTRISYNVWGSVTGAGLYKYYGNNVV